MPSVRNSASSHRGLAGPYAGVKSERVAPPRTPTSRASAGSRSPKKKTSNAFFLYRSYVLANNMIPVDIKHQNDASRVAAQMWRAESHATRSHFFSLAELEKQKQREAEQRELAILMLPTPPRSRSPISSASSSPLATPVSPNPCTPPPAPKMRTRELPKSPSIVELPMRGFAAVSEANDMPEPNYEPLIYALSDEWSCPQSSSSLSLGSGYYDALPKYGSNALGLSLTTPLRIDTSSLYLRRTRH